MRCVSSTLLDLYLGPKVRYYTGMAYTVETERKVAKQIAKLPPRDRERIRVTIHKLGSTPRPAGVEKLTAIGAYRVRTGNYRIVYTIKDTIRVVKVIKVGHRREIYKGL